MLYSKCYDNIKIYNKIKINLDEFNISFLNYILKFNETISTSIKKKFLIILSEILVSLFKKANLLNFNKGKKLSPCVQQSLHFSSRHLLKLSEKIARHFNVYLAT